MGRGPGNLKTEELIKIFDNKNLKFIENLKKIILINFKNITNGVRTNIIRLQLSLKFIQLIFKKCLKIGDIQKKIIQKF